MRSFLNWILNLFRWDDSLEPLSDPLESPVPLPVPPITPNLTTMPEKPVQSPLDPDSIVYRWDTQKHCYHNTRVIADQIGLTLEQKNVLCECIYQESEFLTNPRPNQNKLKNGTVWSTDWGIVQVNDYYNIGAGKPFPSVQYVLDNPDACVRWMAGILKRTGKLTPWSSYTTGAYLKWAVPTSPMWDLKS